MAGLFNILTNAFLTMFQYIYTTLFKQAPRTTTGMGQSEEIQSQPETPEPEEEIPQYQPSIADVLETKQFLYDHCKLPAELVDVVIDFAEYWPHTSSVTAIDPDNPILVRSGGQGENRFLLRSYPLGFIPDTDVPDPFIESQDKRTLNDVVKSSSAFPSKPQPASTQIAGDADATKELLKKWTIVSMSRGPPCRKIVFTMKSHDQGWGGSYEDRGTYKGSFSWFDVGIERVVATRTEQEKETENTSSNEPDDIEEKTKPITITLNTLLPASVPTSGNSDTHIFEHALNPTRNVLHKNVSADKNTKQHIVVWSRDDNISPDSLEGNALEIQGRGRDTGTGEFVRDLKIGDVVTVWAKARFPGWVNVVEEVKVDVYWGV